MVYNRASILTEVPMIYQKMTVPQELEQNQRGELLCVS
jgi:hypothetical protein